MSINQNISGGEEKHDKECKLRRLQPWTPWSPKSFSVAENGLSRDLADESVIERLRGDQFLNNLSGKRKHSKASVLKLLQLVVEKFLGVGGRVEASFQGLSILAGSWFSLQESNRLENRNDSESKCNPDRICVEYLESCASGCKEIIAKRTLCRIFLGKEHTEDRQLCKSAVHDLNLAVPGEFLGGGLLGEAGRVPESHRGEISNESRVVGFPVQTNILFASWGRAGARLLHGASSREGSAAAVHRRRGEGGRASEEGGKDSKLHSFS